MKIDLVWGLTPFSLAEKAMKYLSTARADCEASSPDYSIQNKQWRMKIKQGAEPDYISQLIPAYDQTEAGGLEHSNCRYTLRDSIGRFPLIRTGWDLIQQRWGRDAQF